MNSRVVPKWHKQAAGLLCVVGSLIAFPQCLPASAQDKSEDQNAQTLPPDYLSTWSAPANAPYDYGSGTGTFLGQSYTRSIAWYTDREIRTSTFHVNKNYSRFITMLGVDDSVANGDSRVTFTITGIDKDGNHIILLAATQAQARKPARLINVDVSKCVLITLEQKTDGAQLGGHAAWWGDARFSNEAPARPVETGGGKGACMLVYDDKERKQKLLDLSQDLMKGFTGKDLAVGLFLLESKETPLDSKNAAALQDGLRDALNQTKSTDLTLLKESYGDALKDWKPGDNLSESAQKTLHREIDSHYVLLGTISDRKENALITAAIYDLRTGKPIVTDESTARLPIHDRQFPIPPTVDNGTGTDPASAYTVSATFSPDDNLRVKTYQWFVDGKAQGETKVSELNNVALPIPLDKKKHKFQLMWGGDGYVSDDPFFKGRKKTDYKKYTVNFETEISASTPIVVSVKVNEQPLSHSLSKKVTVDGKDVPVK